MASQTFQVTTRYAGAVETHTFEIGSTDFGNGIVFYASAAAFGCSKNYKTPEAAIRGMCADHDTAVLSIEDGK